MKSLTYSAARETLAATMDEVCEDRVAITITRNRDKAVVMLSLDEYRALEETAHLLRSPPNTRRLFTAMRELEQGDGKERELLP